MSQQLETTRKALAGRYEIDREIGRGGMATVYLARDLKHGRDVAVKVLLDEVAAALGSDRFLREIRIAANLNHPHILAVYDSGDVDGVLHYVMPFVEGESLRGRMNREKQLPIDDAVTIVREVASALGHAHSRGVVHRDIKPENILLQSGLAIVADFGIARAISRAGEDNLTESGLALGTPAYMSPEQSSGDELDGRADIYALGCVLYEMLAGEPPFRGPTSQATMARHAVDPVPSLRTVRNTVTEAMEQAIFRALAKVPADRFATASAFSEALTAAPGHRTSGIHPVSDAPWNSIAVLPFRDMSEQGELTYFCEGMAEELIDALSAVEGVTVASRRSAFAVETADRDIREIGAQLKVGTVLEGSVRSAGGRVRIAVRLNNVADGYQLWAEKYDRDMADVFAIQEEIAQTVATTLRPRLTTEPGARAATEGDARPTPLVKPGTTNLEAYNLCLKGRHHWNRRFEGGLQQAVECFTRALEHDPLFAMAYSGLADCFLAFGSFDFLPPRDSFPRAMAAASKALEIDDSIGDAHSSYGLASMYFDRDWERARRSLERAIEIKPDYASGHQYYAIWLCVQQRFDEAITAVERARDLDPISPMISTTVGMIHYYAGRFNEAIKSFRTTLEIFPDFGAAHGMLGWAYLEVARYDDAIDALERSWKMFPSAAGGLAYAYGVAGREAEARSLIDRLTEKARSEWVSPYSFAVAYAGLDDRPRALEWLEKADEARSLFMIFTDINPMFKRLRDEPGFKQLLTKLDLG